MTSKTMKEGDILSMNFFPMINGYYTALERSAFYQHIPSKRYLELWEINCKVHRRGCELIRPGAKCKDIAAELNEIFMEHGLFQYRTFGYGHSFGGNQFTMSFLFSLSFCIMLWHSCDLSI